LGQPGVSDEVLGREGIALVRDGNIIAHLTTNAWRARM
jgi:hypothetical protein